MLFFLILYLEYLLEKYYYQNLSQHWHRSLWLAFWTAWIVFTLFFFFFNSVFLLDVISCFVPCDSKVISEIHEILILILTPQTSKIGSFATIVNDLQMFTIDVYCCKTLCLRCLWESWPRLCCQSSFKDTINKINN